MRRSDDPVLFHRELVPEAESPWRPPMHVMGLGWALVHTGNAQCLVSLNDCTAGTRPSLFLLQSVVSREMWK